MVNILILSVRCNIIISITSKFSFVYYEEMFETFSVSLSFPITSSSSIKLSKGISFVRKQLISFTKHVGAGYIFFTKITVICTFYLSFTRKTAILLVRIFSYIFSLFLFSTNLLLSRAIISFDRVLFRKGK